MREVVDLPSTSSVAFTEPMISFCGGVVTVSSVASEVSGK